MRWQQRENENARIITVSDGDNELNIIVCLTYRNVMNGNRNVQELSGGTEILHRASIAVGTNYLGELRLVKNRYGIDSINDEIVVRQTIFDSLLMAGFTHYQSSRILGEFNSCLAEILHEEIYYTKDYPYGVSRRRYMIEERERQMVKMYGIKRHSLV